MGWSIGFCHTHKRDIGYGVPSVCDHPDCNEEIHRGLAYVCGGEPGGCENGCGLHFCGKHLSADRQQCERCCDGKPEFDPKPDVPEWITWKLTDESWRQWRDENPGEVEKLRAAIGG